MFSDRTREGSAVSQAPTFPQEDVGSAATSASDSTTFSPELSAFSSSASLSGANARQCRDHNTEAAQRATQQWQRAAKAAHDRDPVHIPAGAVLACSATSGHATLLRLLGQHDVGSEEVILVDTAWIQQRAGQTKGW